MRTFFWVPGRETVYEVGSRPFADAFAGCSPVHNFIKTLYDAPDGSPHEMFQSERELRGHLAALGRSLEDVKFVRV